MCMRPMVTGLTERMGRAARRLRAFRADQEGSMIIFSLFLLIVMLIVGGMAVDLMRFETNRSRLQSTLDRAVLAAADLDQPLDAEGVVEDYFAKAGLAENLTYVDAEETINSSQVTARAGMDINMLFLKLVGIDSMVVPASGTAIESVSDIEIILVLDVSGSMASNNRIENLRTAASEFVGAILENDAENRISIGIVPFNGQINLGAALRGQYATTDQHGVANVNCIDLPPAAFTTPDLSTTLSMPMTAHADTFSSTTTSNAFYAVSANTPQFLLPSVNSWCPPYAVNTVRVPTRSETTLVGHIQGLTAMGATSINAGLRWGIELLDPGSNAMFGNLIRAGQIPTFFSDRPFAYDREDTLKVIVLMSDGENFPEERVNAGYRTGISPIWRGTTDSNYSIFHESRVNRTSAATLRDSRPFWVPHLSQWQARPWGGTSPSTSMPYAEGTNRRLDVNNDGSCTNADDGRGTLTSSQACWTRSTQQTWQGVWQAVRMRWVAWQLYARALGSSNTRTTVYNDQMETFRTLTPAATMDTQLQTMCTMAQDNDVVVFTIAFEAPANGQTQLADCASSPNHYFNAQGLEISDAFRAIAAQINRLRLIE